MTPSHDAPSDRTQVSPSVSFECERDEKAVVALEAALECSDDDETRYWIRTGIQNLLVGTQTPE